MASTSPWFMASTRSDTGDQGHVVLDHQHRDAQVVLDVVDPEGHVLGLLDVQARGRLVQQQQLRLGAQRTRQFDHLAHTVRQAGHQVSRWCCRSRKSITCSTRSRSCTRLARARLVKNRSLQKPVLAVRVAADQQVLQHVACSNSSMFWKVRAMPRARHLVRRLGGELDASKWMRAAGGRVDAADQVEDRGLAGAVGADQREDLAALHVEADLVDGQHAAEAHAQVARADSRGVSGVAHLRRSTSGTTSAA
jgi:hypothetical protein